MASNFRRNALFQTDSGAGDAARWVLEPLAEGFLSLFRLECFYENLVIVFFVVEGYVCGSQLTF